ncbi:hypothetical protein HSE3_gp010 [Bacillus phage vB_BceM-HSE3]|nr:hypothetical protein HSE3_gp010 [Bacillus phage vB_BceM-HSE3]
MARNSFNQYPEDRFTKIPKTTEDNYIWIMWVTKPDSHHPQGGHPILIRRPVKKLFGKTRWERIPDDPRIDKSQVEEWAQHAVEYINANLDADYPHRVVFSSVGRFTPSIVFDTNEIPAY